MLSQMEDPKIFSAAISIASATADPKAMAATTGITSLIYAVGAVVLTGPGLLAFALLGWVAF